MIGTVALLGEGWDCPAINSLVMTSARNKANAEIISGITKQSDYIERSDYMKNITEKHVTSKKANADSSYCDDAAAGFSNDDAANIEQGNYYYKQAQELVNIYWPKQGTHLDDREISNTYKEALAYYKEGVVRHDEAQTYYKKATAFFSKALSHNTESAQLYNSRGLCYAEMHTDYYVKAIDDFTRAIELAPDLITAYVARAKCYHSYGELIQENLECFARTIEYEESVKGTIHEVDTSQAWQAVKNAIKYAVSIEHKNAIQGLAHKLNNDPRNAMYNLKLSFTSNVCEQYNKIYSKKALEDYNMAIHLNDNLRDIYFGNDKRFQKDPNLRVILDAGIYSRIVFGPILRDEYLGHGQRLQLAPYLRDVCFNRGKVNAVLGQHEDAVNDFRKAMFLHDCPIAIYHCYITRGLSHAALGMAESAVKDFRNALLYNPGCPVANTKYYQNLTLKYYQNRVKDDPAFAQYREAIENYSQALKDSNNKKLYSTPTIANFRGRFSSIEAVLTRLAHKASKEEPTKSGGNMTEKALLTGLNTASKFEYYINRSISRSIYKDIRDLKDMPPADIEEARKDFEEAKALNPAKAHFIRGLHYTMCNLHYSRVIDLENMTTYNDKAMEDFENAIMYNSNYVEAYFNCGASYERSRARNKEIGYYAKAISCYNMAIELAPGFSEAYYRRDMCYSSMKEKNPAESGLIETRMLFPKHKYIPYANFRNVNAQEAKKLIAKIEEYTKAMNCDTPANAHALYYGRGECYQKLELYAHAIEDYSIAIKHDPENPQYYNSRGINYLKISNRAYVNRTHAEEDFTKAIGLAPQFAEAYFNRGSVSRSLNDFLSAKELDSRTYANLCVIMHYPYGWTTPPNPSELINKGNSYEYFSDLSSLDPRSAYGHHECAIANGVLGPPEVAIENWTGLIGRGSKSVYLYIWRSQAYTIAGQYQQALDDCNNAIKLEPKNPYNYAAQGHVHDAFGQHKKAIKDYTKAIKLGSGIPDHLFYRGKSYAKLGKHAKAIKDFTRAIEAVAAIEKPVMGSLESRTAAYTERAKSYTALGKHHKVEDGKEA